MTPDIDKRSTAKPSEMRSAKTTDTPLETGNPVAFSSQIPLMASPTLPGVTARGKPAMKILKLSNMEISWIPTTCR